MSNVSYHEACSVFPMMGDGEFRKLKDDIAQNGLLEPICLCDGKILDGRNRHKACEELGIDPKFVAYSGTSPAQFAWSMNGARRHLSKGRLAMVATRLKTLLTAEAEKRMRAGVAPDPSVDLREGIAGRSEDIAARMVGVGGSTVRRAEYVAEHAPELAEQVERDEITVNAAYYALKNGEEAKSQRNKPLSERIDQIRALAIDGNRSEQIADAIGIRAAYVRKLARQHGIELPDDMIRASGTLNIRRVIESTVQGLEGGSIPLRAIKGGKLVGITIEDAQAWADSLDESIKVLNWLRKELRGFANDNE